MRSRRRARIRAALLCAAVLSVGVTPAQAEESRPGHAALQAGSQLRVGVGGRLMIDRGGKSRPVDQLAREAGLRPELQQLWLTRDWEVSWIPKKQLRALAKRGVTPVVVHYYFGDEVSRERFEAARDPWYTSLWRMAQQIRMDSPVLVVLEPEFNQPAPKNETSLTDWTDFADDLRAAAELIRREAPNALVGVCPGDFPGPPDLERVLGPAARHLDFLAFQEMRASTDDKGRPGYRDVGTSAVSFAGYLQRAFNKPILLAYIAISSYGGWEQEQARIIASIARRRGDLLRAGVFGAVYFHLYDEPKHIGYFGAAERHFGLIRGDGVAKPALRAFRSLAEPIR